VEWFGEDEEETAPVEEEPPLHGESAFQARAAEAYDLYRTQFKTRFKWLPSALFIGELAADLRSDARALLGILDRCGPWQAEADAKLEALHRLLSQTHRSEKVLIFTQFADTVRYLTANLQARGLTRLAGVSGGSDDPTSLAWRFSPRSNRHESNRHHPAFSPVNELRVLVATDVLSEGQNLQDAAVIVNYDLPWAIIRLIQRAGRVDRIGQSSDQILCYSFLPADGVEKLIKLRSRVRERLKANAEVVGTDEAFFEDDREKQKLLDLYNEKSGILDGDGETEVDLASYAYQIWKNATEADPPLKAGIEKLPDVVFSTKALSPAYTQSHPTGGVLVYLRTAEGNDALAWMDAAGNPVTQSQFEILRAAECGPDTPAMPRREDHHELTRKGAQHIVAEEKIVGGQLGRPSGARFRTYERLKRHAESVKDTLFDSPQLARAIEEIYRYPLRQSTTDTLNRQLRSGISDDQLADLVIALRDDDRLCIVHEDEQSLEPQIICSLGLTESQNSNLKMENEI
jgi:hypothetical protein